MFISSQRRNSRNIHSLLRLETQRLVVDDSKNNGIYTATLENAETVFLKTQRRSGSHAAKPL